MNIQHGTTDTMAKDIVLSAEGDTLFLEDGFHASVKFVQTAMTVPAGIAVTYVLNLHPSSTLQRILSITLEKGASFTLLGMIAGKPDAPITLSLKENHAGVASTSSVRLRGLLPAGATLEVKGTLAIQKHASKSDAYLESRALLLGEGAHASMTPSLEIEARDVKAAHAAASGPINKDELFYLGARGIPTSEARSLIVSGFMNDLLQRIPDESLRTSLTEQWQAILATP